MGYKNKNKIIAVLFVALFFMTVGYAVFSQQLKLDGVAKITSTFNVKFIDAKSNATGGAYDIVAPSFTDDTVTFNTGLTSPGDVMVYELTVKNAGTLDAYLSNVAVTNSDNPAILIKTSGIVDGELLKADGTKVIYVTVELDRNITVLPENLSANFSVTLNYKQDINNVGTSTAGCFTTSTEGNVITGYDMSCGTDVVIPSEINGITIDTIGDQAFYKLGIDSVVIPNTITNIQKRSFYQNNLTTLIIPNSVVSIDDRAFEKNIISTLSIPSSVTFIGYRAFTNNQMPSGQEFVYNRNSDGSLNKASLNSYAGADRSSIVIPNTVTELGEGAFYACDIEEVVLPENLETIGEDAFIYNHLSTINIPSSVTLIEKRAFNANVVPSDNNPFIYKRNVDGSIDNTTIVSYAGGRDENVVVPEGVVMIEDSAFYDTGVHTITLPQSLEIIETAAFKYCWFTTVTIPAGVTKIGKGAFLKDDVSNKDLTKIINTTNRNFDWSRIVNDETTDIKYVTGTVTNTHGDVVIASE